MSCNCGGVRSDIAAIGKYLASLKNTSSKPEREAEKKIKAKAKTKKKKDDNDNE